MTDFVRGSNPVWYFVDLAGVQTDDNFYLWILENDIPYQPATVYQSPTGTPWSNPIQFLANGTLPTNIYFDQNQCYRLEIRQNDGTAPPSQADALIYLIENYYPKGDASSDASTDQVRTNNQITNPQFADINFTSPYTLSGVTDPGPIEIAPGWFLELVGTGGLTLERVPLNNAITTPTNAPYALRLTLTAGWTQAPVLRQRFQQNGQLWSEKFIASSYTARVEGATQNVTSRLVASDGTPLLNLGTEAMTNAFVEYLGSGTMPATTNADLPPDAYIDFEFVLPQVVDLYITSVQVQTVNSLSTATYEQTTVNRQIDHTFNVYRPQLIDKPIPSHLIGWDFPRNPAQWGENYAVAAIGANKSDYVWDQTIIFQSVDDGFTVSRDTTGAMKIEIEEDATQIALVQYVEQSVAREILNGRMAVNLSTKKANGGDVSGIVSIWYTSAALPDMSAGTNNSLIATLNANGTVATRNGTWSEVPRRGSENAQFTVTSSATNNFNETMLNGWDLGGSVDIDTATTVAIVVGFESMDDGEIVDIESISLCSGDIATKPAPLSLTDTLKSCERYYEKSYKQSDSPGDATVDNCLTHAQAANVLTGTGTYTLYNSAFGFHFKTQKVTDSPAVSIYSVLGGAAGNVEGNIWGDGAATYGQASQALATYWSSSTISDKGAQYQPGGTVPTAVQVSSGAGMGPGIGWIRFHYVADARLGTF